MDETRDADAAPGSTSPFRESAPFGCVGSDTDRDASGRFQRGNRAALVIGTHSATFWRVHEEARLEIRRDVIADAGFTEGDAPRALQIAADGIAQATLLRDAAFLRVAQSGGPLTSVGRTRRAFSVWLTSADRLEKYLRLVGLRRAPKPALSLPDYLRRIAHEDERADASSEASTDDAVLARESQPSENDDLAGENRCAAAVLKPSDHVDDDDNDHEDVNDEAKEH